MANGINPRDYDTDKADLGHYFRNYQERFAALADRDVKFLEMGVNRGGSLLLWRDYFKNGTIVGLDVNPCTLEDSTGRVRVYRGRQQDIALLDRIARENAPEGFDIIIDDCSHIGELSRISFWHLFTRHLKPGGLYAIEDWGTGYWQAFPDGKYYRERSRPSWPYRAVERLDRIFRFLPGGKLGGSLVDFLFRAAVHKRRFKSHDYGMVGFVKQLVDEVAMADITCPGPGLGPARSSLFTNVQFSWGQVIVRKAGEET